MYKTGYSVIPLIVTHLTFPKGVALSEEVCTYLNIQIPKMYHSHTVIPVMTTLMANSIFLSGLVGVTVM